jgi:hypothetical protein
MLHLIVCAACLTAGTVDGLLDACDPQLQAFSPVYIRYAAQGSEIDAALLRRADEASIAVSSSVFPSQASRVNTISSQIEGSMQRRSRPGTASYDVIHRSLTGAPIGDLIYCFEDSASKHIQFSTGAEGCHVTINFAYKGTGRPGHIRWQVGDYQSDRVLVEDLARRVLGRMLAWQHFTQVRSGTATTATQFLTDAAGRGFVSVAHWAASHGATPQAERNVAVRFSYHRQRIVVVAGANSIKVGTEWRPLGGYATEVGNRVFVPLQGFQAALP